MNLVTDYNGCVDSGDCSVFNSFAMDGFACFSINTSSNTLSD